MLQFFTIIPLPFKLEPQREDFGKGLVFAPVVGFMLGGLLAAAFSGLRLLLPGLASAVLVQVLYVAATGGIHLDGLGDTYDGLFPRRGRERMLEIMRDSRVGTNAVLAVVSVFLLNTSLIAGIDAGYALPALIILPAAGRAGSLLSCAVSTYAREGEGLGRCFIEFCGFREAAAGLILYFPLCYAFAGLAGLVSAAVTACASLALTRFFAGRIGGSTGDVAGAVCELSQTVFLLCACILAGAGGKWL